MNAVVTLLHARASRLYDGDAVWGQPRPSILGLPPLGNKGG